MMKDRQIIKDRVENDEGMERKFRRL